MLSAYVSAAERGVNGIGERLIHVDRSILNDPSFRAAGWSQIATQDGIRTYSPPIPTAVSSDYFVAPIRAAIEEEEEEGGLVTGKGSTDTVGPAYAQARRRKLREQVEEDDSSDLSDDSEDESEISSRRAAQQIKFSKMPVRNRSGSSPVRGSPAADLMNPVTSASRHRTTGRLRSGSLTSVEAIKQIARRDTTTSSEFSSETDQDSLSLQRRGPNKRHVSETSLAKGEVDTQRLSSKTIEPFDDGHNHESDSDQSSDFGGELAGSGSILEDLAGASTGLMPAPLRTRRRSLSPKKIISDAAAITSDFSCTKPTSTAAGISLLSQALKAHQSVPKNPVERFARLSGQGDPDPLYIKIFVPHSQNSKQLIDLLLVKNSEDSESAENSQVTVADAIGLTLWRYTEDKLTPPLSQSQLNVNKWTMRMIEDGEVDFDFPALMRTKAMMDFTSNNNRGVRGRMRGKPYDDFALVAATETEFRENQTLTPSHEPPIISDDNAPDLSEVPSPSAPARKAPVVPADKPQLTQALSTPRMGPPKDLRIFFTSVEAASQMMTVSATTDTYLAEILAQACRRWNLDKTFHLFKIRNTNTIAPIDRTVEALGNLMELDLTRRRFATDGGTGFSSSPGSSSPNAPVLLDSASPKKTTKRAQASAVHPLSRDRTRDLLALKLTANTSSFDAERHRRFEVIRKQTMSLAPSQPRVLVMDGENLNILLSDNVSNRTLQDASGSKAIKRIPYALIIGCKVSRRHPKSLRVLVSKQDNQREDDQKRYDFEAQSALEAAEIVEQIKRGIDAHGTS